MFLQLRRLFLFCEYLVEKPERMMWFWLSQCQRFQANCVWHLAESFIWSYWRCASAFSGLRVFFFRFIFHGSQNLHCPEIMSLKMRITWLYSTYWIFDGYVTRILEKVVTSIAFKINFQITFIAPLHWNQINRRSFW